MNGTLGFISGLGIGALGMFLMDPQQGRGRRALVSQKMERMGRNKTEAWAASKEDAQSPDRYVAQSGQGKQLVKSG